MDSNHSGSSYSSSFTGETIGLDDLCTSIIDCPHSTPKWSTEGPIVIRNFNIKNGELDLSNPSFTDPESFKDRVKRAAPEPGDIIITREAPMGEVCLVPEGLECCLGQRMVLLKVNQKKISSQYLLFALQSEFVQKQIRQSDSTGSIVSNLCIPDLRALKIPILDDSFQVATTLKAITEKIELNKRINAQLEAMAKTLYAYWMIQFDFPDASGKPYKTSGGAMVYNKVLKRKIPEGWDIAPLREVTGVSNKSINPVDHENKLFRLFSIPVYDDTKSYSVEVSEDIRSNKFTVKESDILVSKLNPRFSRVIYALDEEDMICSTEFVVWRTPNSMMKNFLYMVARSPQFIAHCTQSATGTSNSHKRVNPDVMMRFELPFQKEIASALGQKLEPMIRKIAINEREIAALVRLKDWLLPMFMNGQIKVGKAAKSQTEVA